MRLLLVEDDPRTADYIVRGLSKAGHACDLLRNGHEALAAATRNAYDVIVADRMVPGLDGLSMIKAVRAAGIKTPAIFLTSIGGVDD
ncbi:MAG: response regulator, partial [Mesorhizobium sp.]